MTNPAIVDSTEKLSFREKFGYGLGDTAANFIFQTLMIFQLAFYTDTFGISAAAAGTLFLIVRGWDAVFDPIMGIVADRTHTRWGKFRPWVLWTAVPFGIMAFLAFSTPNLGATGKLIYAYVTYTLLMMVYSANNLPYSALSGVITGDVGERTSVSSYRFFCMTIAAFVIQGLALPMVKFFGNGNDATGYRWTMGIFAVLAVIFFVITFLSTKERITPDPRQKSTVRRDAGDLLQNGPWIAMFFLTLILFITLALRNGVMVYYFKYNVGRENLLSPFLVSGLAATLVGIGFARPIATRFGKRNVFIAGLIGTAVFTAAFTLLPANAIALMFVGEVLRQLAYGFTIPLLWAMMADVADFSEWTTGRRATGMVFAGIVFALKAGLGVGGAIEGWLLAAYGYVPNVAQSAHALLGIRLVAGLFPGITFAVCIVCLLFYRIGRNMEFQMTRELAERRRAYAAAPALETP
jgi:GPH family glycoside/pentoside/hexuronide:cation symporter